eukprot:6709509-Prymnesium_polylepis.1
MSSTSPGCVCASCGLCGTGSACRPRTRVTRGRAVPVGYSTHWLSIHTQEGHGPSNAERSRCMGVPAGYRIGIGLGRSPEG